MHRTPERPLSRAGSTSVVIADDPALDQPELAWPQTAGNRANAAQLAVNWRGGTRNPGRNNSGNIASHDDGLNRIGRCREAERREDQRRPPGCRTAHQSLRGRFSIDKRHSMMRGKKSTSGQSKAARSNCDRSQTDKLALRVASTRIAGSLRRLVVCVAGQRRARFREGSPSIVLRGVTSRVRISASTDPEPEHASIDHTLCST